MSLALIVAVADNGVIGCQGAVPWHSAEDLRWFREVTMGHTCLMGRKTWEGLRAPLAGRQNLVLTRQGNYRPRGAEVVRDLASLVKRYADSPETLFVCGGAEVYRAVLPEISKVYWTAVHLLPPGETLFPNFPQEAFREVFRRESLTEPNCSFRLLERRALP